MNQVNTVNDRIVTDPNICHGKPTIRGTRMPVSLILGSLAGGMSFDDLRKEYDLTDADIRAALAYGADLAAHEQHLELPAGT